MSKHFRFDFVLAAAMAVSLVAFLALREQARQALQAQRPAAVPAGNEPGRSDALGDPLPPGAFARLGTVRLRQSLTSGWEAALAFSPDGTMLAAAGWHGVGVWDVSTGRELGWLRGKARGNAVRFSADGKMLTTANSDGSFQVWETGTGKLLQGARPARDIVFFEYPFTGRGRQAYR
jgi:hypothetical protein